LMFLGLGVLPIYGGGENLLGGGGSYRTAYTLYRETIGPMVAAWRP
jgi:hypothetical protein